MSKRITIYKDRIEKIATPDASVMAEKYAAVHAISQRCGFRAPELISVDSEAQTITIERIRNLRSVRDIYLDFQKRKQGYESIPFFFLRIGQALARLHSELALPRFVAWAPNEIFMRRLCEYGGAPSDLHSAPVACLHCDFGFLNVLVHGEEIHTAEIVIVDPCANGGSTHHDWESGPIYVDIGKFLSCLEGQVPIHSQLFLEPARSSELQIAFIRGYETIAQQPINRQLAFSCAYAVSAAQFDSRYGYRSAFPISALYNRVWKRNFPYEVKKQFIDRLEHAV